MKPALGVLACAMTPAFLDPLTELASGEQPLRDLWFVSFLAAGP
ncbi:hypothetical protein [Streptomyces globisporus]|nr:hypothetical protein [Streptomyces globisporus]